MEMASKSIEHRRRLASGFIAELPLLMDIAAGQAEDGDQDEESRVGMHTHNMFFTSAKGKQFSVVGELLKLKDTVGKTDVDEYSVSIAVASRFDDLTGRVCNFGRFQLDDEVRHAVLQVAATSAMALVQVGECSVSISEVSGMCPSCLTPPPYRCPHNLSQRVGRN
jgi:hypothetical protein